MEIYWKVQTWLCLVYPLIIKNDAWIKISFTWNPSLPPKRTLEKVRTSGFSDQCVYKTPFEAWSAIFSKTPTGTLPNEFCSFHWASANFCDGPLAKKTPAPSPFTPAESYCHKGRNHTVIHFYFGADLISVISVQAFFTEIKSLPKFLLRVDGCSCLSGSLSRYRNFLRTETANFRFTENCTLPK